jgi:hypothetical protein
MVKCVCGYECLTEMEFRIHVQREHFSNSDLLPLKIPYEVWRDSG